MKTNINIEGRMIVILRDSFDAITVLDLVGNFLAWNKGAERLYGYSEQEALRMNIMQIIPVGQRVGVKDLFGRLESGELVKPFETQRISKDGNVVDVSVVFSCLKDDNGIIHQLATTERDITELKNELRRKKEELKLLRKILPICASCKRIRDSKNNWHQIEEYIHNKYSAEFSHGICPACMKELYPDIYEKIQKNTSVI